VHHIADQVYTVSEIRPAFTLGYALALLYCMIWTLARRLKPFLAYFTCPLGTNYVASGFKPQVNFQGPNPVRSAKI